jgi:DNA-binding response OmpR family regulator
MPVTVTVPSILLIEDEPLLRDAMMAYLNLDGFHCHSVGSLDGFRAFQASGQTVDVMVFDLGLPDGDGLDAIGPLVDISPDIGVVIVSARGAVTERIEGLKRGADAYLPKPVDLVELSLILKKLVRRSQNKPVHAWRLDRTTWRLQAPTGAEVALTMREQITLGLVMAKPGTPVSRDVLVKAWGFDPVIYDFRRMESTLRRLRNKCQDELGCALPLVTIYGFGFVFEQRASTNHLA